MTNPTPHGQVPAIQRYSIGDHSDEWGVRSLSPTGIYDDAGPWVRYEDHAAVITALRTQQPAPATQQAGVRPVTPYTCPKCHALWLHWPAEQTGFGRDTLNCRSADHCHYCEKAGVEQLQRLERIPAALHAPQPSPTAQSADSVQEDAARWHWMAEYIVGTRTDLDDELIASATVDDLRKLVDADLATRKQGATQ